MNEVYATIALLGAVPGYFFSVLIWRKNGQYYANKVLVAALVAYSSILLSLFLSRRGMGYSQLVHVFINSLVHVAWPLFFVYLRCITTNIRRFNKRDLFQGLPFLLYLLFLVAPAMMVERYFAVFFVLSMGYTAIVATGYSIAMFLVLSRYKKRVADFHSQDTRLKLTWIKTNLILWFVIIGVQMVFFLLRTLGVEFSEIVLMLHGLFINLATVAWIYVIAYFSVSHPNIFDLSLPMNQGLETSQEPTDESDNLTGPNKAILARLEVTMARRRPYLDSQLTLAGLARLVNAPAYLLGRVINRELNKNFMTYINEYRIAEAKKMLLAENHLNAKILDIAYECGFRSKSAFNTFFKKSTGLTPSQFRKKSANSAG